MIKTENIHPDVQRALYRKIEGNQKLLVQGNFDQNGLLESKPFNSSILDADTNTNPIGQEFYRMAFAKVSIAVPDIEKSKNSVVLQPISISSYIDVLEKDNILSTTQKNQPLSFYQGYQESTDNRFRGHSGITKIGVAQQEYYTYKYTIDWVCPDPVYFEDIFQPSFLKFGAFCTIEFGYGTNTGENRIPDMTIETMRALIKEGNRDRLLKYSPGTYYCDVAQIHNFDWKIDSDGTYTGTLTAVSLGYSPLVEPTKKVQTSLPAEDNDEPEVSLNNNLLLDKITKDVVQDNDLTTEQLETLAENQKEIQKLIESSAGFSSVMENFEKLLDKYLETAGEPSEKKRPDNTTITIYVDSIHPNQSLYFDENTDSLIKYRYKNGVLKYSVEDIFDKETKKKWIELWFSGDWTNLEKNPVLDLDLEEFKEQYLIQWGWFEDTMLKSFFELSSGKDTIQEIKSFDFVPIEFEIDDEGFEVFTDDSIENIESPEEPTKCISSDFLYSLGLDEVILPKKHHPFKSAIKDLDSDDKLKIKQLYSREARAHLDIVNGIYDLIDKTFGEDYPFETSATRGIIRNMVFPIELYKTHFQGATNLVQAMRGFWNDVSSKYGGYWRFQVGQDPNLTKRIGVTDRRTIDVPNPTEENASEDIEEKIKYPFMFNIYSKNSIVREFDVNLELTAEMATLVRYGNQSDKGGAGITGLTDVSAEAWNLLNNKKISDLELKETSNRNYQQFLKIQDKLYKNLSYPAKDGFIIDTKNNKIKYQEIPEIKDSKKAKLEKIDSGRFGFYKGVGVYDKNGNMSPEFKTTMIYLLTNAKIEGSQSLVTQGQIPMPLRISLKLDGIGGLKVGDIFKIDYLPKQYRSKTYFVIEKINHSVGRSGWTTDINAFMVYDAKSDEDRKKQSISASKQELIEFFKKTTYTKEDLDQALIDYEKSIVAGQQGTSDSTEGFEENRRKFETNVKEAEDLITNPLPNLDASKLQVQRDLVKNKENIITSYGEIEKLIVGKQREDIFVEIKDIYFKIIPTINNKIREIEARAGEARTVTAKSQELTTLREGGDTGNVQSQAQTQFGNFQPGAGPAD